MTKRVPAKKVSQAEDGLSYCDGKPFTGIAYTEHPDGTLESESEYRDGLLWGRVRSWYRDGTLADDAEYLRDVIHGTAREWSEEGVLISEIVCEYGITLSEKTWDEEGNLEEEFRLQKSDPNYKLLLRFRKAYGAEDS